MTNSSKKVADSSFNDDELADIMAEIEGLEKEALGNSESQPDAAAGDAGAGEDTPVVASSTEEGVEAISEEQEELLEKEMTSLSTANNENSVPANSLQDAIDREIEAAKSESKVLTFPARETTVAGTTQAPAISSSSVKGVQEPFSLNCNMSEFKINFQVEGQSFTLEVGPECGVCLTLADGAKLSVPWKKKVA